MKSFTAQEIQNSIQEHKELLDSLQKTEERVKEVNRYCLSVIGSRLRGYRVYDQLLGYPGGPCYSVVVTSGPKCLQSGAYFHYTSEGEFAWYRDNSHEVYAHERVTKPDPIDTEKFLKTCEELTQELGVRVAPLVTGIQKSPAVPYTDRDILAMYPGCVIQLSGDIIYKGWDCRDAYCVFLHGGKKYLRYGSSGHGSGMTHCVMEGQDLSDFFALCGEEADGLRSLLW